MNSTISAPSGIDVKRYGRLLARFTPKVIENEAENDAALAIVESLLEKGEDSLTPEERTIFELLTTLIEQFEDKAYPVPDGDPKDVLNALMEHNELKAADLADLLGSRAKVSEILSGARSISKEQAKRLGARFRVSPAIFI
jgi:HTH-type transcriptional regulator/antitoxin HigA